MESYVSLSKLHFKTNLQVHSLVAGWLVVDLLTLWTDDDDTINNREREYRYVPDRNNYTRETSLYQGV
jgi:hypothetical protein